MLISEQVLTIHEGADYDNGHLDFSGFPDTPIQLKNGKFFRIGDVYHYFKQQAQKPKSFLFHECGTFSQMITLSENVAIFKNKESFDGYSFPDLFQGKRCRLFSFARTWNSKITNLNNYHFLYKDGCLVYVVNNDKKLENDPFTHLIDTNGKHWQFPIALSPIHLEKVQGGYILDASDEYHPLGFVFNENPFLNLKGKRFFLSAHNGTLVYLGKFPISATKKFSFYQNTAVSEDNFVFLRNEHIKIDSYHVADYHDDMRLINFECSIHKQVTSTLSCFLNPTEWNKLPILADSLRQESITVQNWMSKFVSAAHNLFDGNIHTFN